MRIFLFVALVLLACPTASWATDWPAATCSRTDVVAAIASASDGDTVTIPACTQTNYTTQVTVNKNIVVRGTDTGGTPWEPTQTLDANNIPQAAAWPASHTILGDNVTKDGSSTSKLFEFNCSSSTFECGLATMEIVGVATDPSIFNKGHVGIFGTATKIHVHHVKFTALQTAAIRTSGCLDGLFDHIEFGGNHKDGILWEGHSNCNGGTNGDGPWATATALGTANAMFLEDSTLVDPSGVGAGIIDVFNGGKVVVRHSTFCYGASHGTESGGRRRGLRQFEFYSNVVTNCAAATSQSEGIFIRSGTGVITGNEFTTSPSGGGFTQLARFDNDRSKDTFSPWGYCAGSGNYDNNDGTDYVTGTHDGANGVAVLSDAGKNFTTACNAGESCQGHRYSIINTTQAWSSTIASVTTTTVSRDGSAFGGSYLWNTGDAYAIRRAYPCIDQVGRGAGTSLSGDPPVPTGWVAEASEPVHFWSNTKDSVPSSSVGSTSKHVVIGEDVLTTSLAGYAEYTYPHPLQGGGGAGGIASLSSSGVTCNDAPYGTKQACGTNLTLTNIGTGTLTISSISLATGVQITQTNDCGATLAPSAFCTITVSFRPLQVGAIPKDILSATSDGGNPTCSFDGTGLSIHGKQGAGIQANGKHS